MSTKHPIDDEIDDDLEKKRVCQRDAPLVLCAAMRSAVGAVARADFSTLKIVARALPGRIKLTSKESTIEGVLQHFREDFQSYELAMATWVRCLAAARAVSNAHEMLKKAIATLLGERSSGEWIRMLEESVGPGPFEHRLSQLDMYYHGTLGHAVLSDDESSNFRVLRWDLLKLAVEARRV